MMKLFKSLSNLQKQKSLSKRTHEPKTIAYFRKMGYNMVAAHKFQGSRLQYTKKIKRFKKIICSDSCKNTIYELQPLTYKTDKNGNIIEDEFKIDPHTLSAIWYALDDYEVTDLKEQPKERKRPNTSLKTTKQIHDDSFNYEADGLIEPPYNITELKQIAEYSTILQQCIDAYKTNILGFGLGIEYVFDFNAENAPEGKKKTAEKEWTRLEEFGRYMNYDESAEVVLGYVIEDRERTGNGFLEVLRNGKGQPAGVEYLDAQYMHICKIGDPVEIDFKYTDQGQVKSLKRMKRFRKYVQKINTKKVFFKEYGDPRTMNAATGEYSEDTPSDLVASEVIPFKIGSGTYGVPGWIGNIVNMYGARKAEELNYLYFKQGRHVPAAITVENGMYLKHHMNSCKST